MCHEDVPQDSCLNSIEHLVEATVMDSFLQNPQIAPIASIEITNRSMEDNTDVFFDYVIGVEERLHVVTGPDVSSDNWITIMRDVTMSAYRLGVIFAK